MDLPAHNTKEKLKSVLLMAIQSCGEIDADQDYGDMSDYGSDANQTDVESDRCVYEMESFGGIRPTNSF